jgi:hypothetical protein
VIEFSEIVYRGFGPHHRKGGSFNSIGVKSPEEMKAKLADGWYATLHEAIEAHDNPTKVDEAPATRGELEVKAKELKLTFDGRTSDAKLLKMIDEALKA